MATLKNSVIMGSIYDSDTDCRYVLMRVTAKAWDQYKTELEKEENE